MEKHVLILGAGPAGLTAAYKLSQLGIAVTVMEADSKYVGGISRTVVYKKFRFDIGGHRFFSKSQEIEDLWTEIMPDMADRPRSSRIFYRGKFFSYPLKPMEALFKLGIIESVICMTSFFWAKLTPVKNPKNFEDWTRNQFGYRLFSIFFKTYTEKVWGMDCKTISADWAAQRIKGLSLGSAIWQGLIPRFLKPKGAEAIKSLIESFRYPRLGPGMLWETCAEKVKSAGGKILLNHKVSHLRFDKTLNQWNVSCQTPGGVREVTGTHVISSMPIYDLVPELSPAVAEQAVEAAKKLRYRDFVTVALMLKEKNNFTDNWIYIHDPAVRVGRIQNYKSWSPDMVPDANLCCYGLEYFCVEGDQFWEKSDSEIMEIAKFELSKIGLAKSEDILDGCVVRQQKAYPVYDENYSQNVASVAKALEDKFPSLYLVGRNGMHKYNNQDHAMMTAILTVKNIMAGKRIYDVWNVNQDAEYHESGLRSVPRKIA